MSSKLLRTPLSPAWTKVQTPGQLWQDAAYLAINTLVQGVSGVGFWWIAARFFPVHVLGGATLLITAANFIGSLANLGLGYGFVRFRNDADVHEESRLIGATVAATAVVSIVAGLLYCWWVTMRGRASVQFGSAEAAWLVVPLAFLSVSVSSVLDPVLVSVKRGKDLLAKSCIIHGGRFLALMAIGLLSDTPIAILGALMVGFLAGDAWALRKSIAPAFPGFLSAGFRLPRRYLSFSIANQAAVQFFLAPSFFLPLAVGWALSQSEVALFYIPWMLASIIQIIPWSLSSSMFVNMSKASGRPAHHVQGTVIRVTVLAGTASVFLMLIAPWMLQLFGGDYRSRGTTTLVILCLANVPYCITAVSFALMRIDKSLRLVLASGMAVAVLPPAVGVLLARSLGIDGFAWGWLIFNLLFAVGSGRFVWEARG